MQIDAQIFNDREMFHDALCSQKQITESYNLFANECAAPQVRDTLMNLLNEEHQIQFELFTEMSKRGWVPVQPAEPAQIRQAQQKFRNLQANL